MEDRNAMIAQINALKELQRRRARRYLRDFLPYINPKYTMKWFHKEIADAVQAVFEGLEKKIMISLPPQHGKSEIVSRDAPAWGLGIDPDIPSNTYCRKCLDKTKAALMRELVIKNMKGE